MKIPKFTIIEWSVIVWLTLSTVLAIIIILQPDPPERKSIIERAGEAARGIKDEFNKGYHKDSIQ